MSTLNNLVSDTAQQSTTMPSWYDTANQNTVNQATTALNAAPQPNQTVAQNAVNTLSGPTNPFTTAAGTAQSIASGAANPWMTDASGNTVPNPNTAMGGLFQAENQQLNQLMPNYTAPAEAGAIGSGNFGSLRGQTAVNKARGDAFANLTTQQLQAALQNQQTGVAAAGQAGNLSAQDISNLLQTGQYQQASPFANASNYGKIIGGISAPTTTTNQTQYSPLSMITGLSSALGGTSGVNSILTSLGIPGGLSGIPGLFGLGGNNTSPGTDNTASGSLATSDPNALAPLNTAGSASDTSSTFDPTATTNVVPNVSTDTVGNSADLSSSGLSSWF
jgi:hypothetical protein